MLSYSSQSARCSCIRFGRILCHYSRCLPQPLEHLHQHRRIYRQHLSESLSDYRSSARNPSKPNKLFCKNINSQVQLNFNQFQDIYFTMSVLMAFNAFGRLRVINPAVPFCSTKTISLLEVMCLMKLCFDELTKKFDAIRRN
jgi:hypothetical protein